MLEEGRVRADWNVGAFEKNEVCRKCGSKSAWGQKHQCCQTQCHESLNALQAFPYAACDDISAAPLDPVKVTAARKLEIEYAEKKPVWTKIPRLGGHGRWGMVVLRRQNRQRQEHSYSGCLQSLLRGSGDKRPLRRIARALQGDETPLSTVGKLLAGPYGTRNALASWQEEVTPCMRE